MILLPLQCFSIRKFGSVSKGIDSCGRVALPNQRCMNPPNSSMYYYESTEL